MAQHRLWPNLHSPLTSVFHSPEFVTCLREVGLSVHAVQARLGSDLVGLALVFEDSLYPLPLIGKKGFCPGGFLAHDLEVKTVLLEGLKKHFARKQLYLEVYEAQSTLEPLAQNNLSTQDYLNFLIDLREEQAETFDKYNRSMRRNIRRAAANALRLKEVTTTGDLKAAFRLLRRTSRRVQAPLLPWVLFKAIFEHLVPAGFVKIYLAEMPDGQAWRPVNTRVELLYQGVATDWFTGSDESTAQQQTGAWLVDQVLRDLKSKGIQTFDFGGAGRVGQNYGPAEFKRRFGGEEVGVRRVLHTYHPHLKQLARKVFLLRESVKRFLKISN
jgi:serine/alanine adding enzyme